MKITYLPLTLTAVLAGCLNSDEGTSTMVAGGATDAPEADDGTDDSAGEEVGMITSERFGDLRVTTIPTLEGASAELVDLKSGVVVAALDWDGHSSTLEIEISESEVSIDLDSPPEVGDLGAILLAAWQTSTIQDVDSFQTGKGDDNVATTAPLILCQDHWAYLARIAPPTPPISHDACSDICTDNCGYSYGFRWSHTQYPMTFTDDYSHLAKCYCYN